MTVKKERYASWENSWAHLNYYDKYRSVVRALLDRQANPNCRATISDPENKWHLGDTPLTYVLRLNDSHYSDSYLFSFTDCLSLLKRGADPTLKNDSGESAEDLVASDKNYLLIKQMFKDSKEIQKAAQDGKFSIYDWLEFYCYNRLFPTFPSKESLLQIPEGEKKTVYEILMQKGIPGLLSSEDSARFFLNSALQQVETHLKSNDKKPLKTVLKERSQSSSHKRRPLTGITVQRRVRLKKITKHDSRRSKTSTKVR